MPIVDFLVANFPAPRAWLALGPPSLALAAAYLYAAGRLKRDRGWRTGYTRKLFHFLVFTTAAAVQAALGFAALAVFGTATSLVIFYALVRGERHVLYEAMARESDAPRRTWFVVVPYLATLAGGLLASSLFGVAAVYGTLVAGLGDAVGEPVGVRFGRHRYRVPSARGVPSQRSYEGSLAVFAGSVAALALAALATGGALAWPALVLIGALSAVAEAVSPHGWDNLTMQVLPAALAAWIL